MRRKEREIKDQEQLEFIIRQAHVLRIAMSVHDIPYIVPVNFGYDAGVFYFHCANEGRKLDMIKTNPNVCFELDTDHELIRGAVACQYTMRYKSIIGYGKALICTDETDKQKGLDAVMKHFSDETFTYDEAALRRVTIVKILVSQMTGKAST